MGDASIPVPVIHEASKGDLVLGVRPEHVRFDDKSKLRGEVYSTEYLGTTQIVTVKAKHGTIKARISSTLRVETGEQVGLTFAPEKLSLFNKTTGRALRSALHEGANHG